MSVNHRWWPAGAAPVLVLMPFVVSSPTPARAAGPICDAHDLVVSRSMSLDPRCHYTGTVTITGSGLTLDCNGATLDGEGKVPRTLIVGGERRVTKVEVRNCVVTGGRSEGLFVGLTMPDGRKPTDAQGRAFYNRHPQDIELRNLTVRRNGRSGVYVDDYVQNVTIADSVIEQNGGVGIYLEHSSRHNRVVGSRILDNGHGAQSGIPGADSGPREGIAIDSSADNLIEGNVISGNVAGGISLYRNCGEQPGNPDQVKRWQPTAHNLIRNNEVEGGRVGIWVASRQDWPYRQDQCRLVPDPAQGIFPDAAPANQVEGNTIGNVVTGIRVADDDNEVSGNRVEAQTSCLVLGSEDRDRRGRPVKGLAVVNNRCANGAVQVVPETGLAPQSRLP